MGLKRNGDLYGLKATCARKTRSQQSGERETTKRKLIEEILKEKDSRKKRKLSSTGTCSSSPTAIGETSSKRLMDKKSLFTVKGHFECFKLSRVQLYLTCRRWDHSDDDNIPLKSMLEPSTSSSNNKSSTRKNKGKSWLQKITTQLENERKMWRKLKADQEEEEKKILIKKGKGKRP